MATARPAEAPADASRERVLALLERHGWNATSFQILEPGFRYWFDGDDACVGYVDTGRAWVAAGPPIAAPERLAEIARGVRRAAAAAGAAPGLHVRDRGAVPRRRELARAADRRAADLVARGVGRRPARAASSLREQLRRARAKGVVVRALRADELAPGHATRAELDALIARWLAVAADRADGLPRPGRSVHVPRAPPRASSPSTTARRRLPRRDPDLRAARLVLRGLPARPRRAERHDRAARRRRHARRGRRAASSSSRSGSRRSPATSAPGCARRAGSAARSTTSTACARSRRSSQPRRWDPIFLSYPPGAELAARRRSTR